jgi:hypothetical protein
VLYAEGLDVARPRGIAAAREHLRAAAFLVVRIMQDGASLLFATGRRFDTLLAIPL